MFAKDTNRGHAHERLKTNLANSGRISGMGISYDNYSENSYPVGAYPAPNKGTPVHKPLTQEESDFIHNGGKVKTYKLSKAELQEMGYIKK